MKICSFFYFSKSLKIGLCVFVNMNSTNSWKVYIVFDFKDLKKKFPAARYMIIASRWRWFPYFYLCLFWNEWIISFIAAIHLFQVHVGHFKRGCLLDTRRMLAIEKFSLKYNFSKLWYLLKEVLIMKFHFLWMLSFIVLYVLYSWISLFILHL